MKEILKIAGAFIGFVMGAGFASGQELIQFYVSFGTWGLIGTLLSSVVFIVMGMTLASYGSHLKADSHKQVVQEICGKWLGKPIDLLMTFSMFAAAVVMIAGSGALLQQQFELPATFGSLMVTALVIFVTWLKPERVIGLISAITPLLIVVTVLIGGYAIVTKGTDYATLAPLAEQLPRASQHWLLAALLYVSYNIFACVAILAISGGAIHSPKTAALGGLLGGLTLGGLMLLMSMALLSHVEVIAEASMPMLALAQSFSPNLALGLSIVMFLMIFNTAVGALYSFSSRMFTADTQGFRIATLVFGLLAYMASLYGFIELVGLVYPSFGYIGFVLMIAIAWAGLKQRKVALTCAAATIK
ncbi:hypothetical protein [Ferrimonas gelatinilytica]|uniref:Membrane protein n=1 Tax=Ferrimonas gelatinilytica TaxID=1255257 RepID=A0ABP9S057_9GAMM